MLTGIGFNINEKETIIAELKRNVIIICENQSLVDLWRDILLNIKEDREFDVFVDFEGLTEDNFEYFLQFISKLSISEDKNNNLVSIYYPNCDVQHFYVSTNADIVYHADSYEDIIFQLDNGIIYLSQFRDVGNMLKNNDKEKICRWIKDGRYTNAGIEKLIRGDE
jgi:choline kinase